MSVENKSNVFFGSTAGSFKIMSRKVLTLLLVVDETKQRVLLGLKKRGFGIGKWNGFGGKVETGESVSEAAKRGNIQTQHFFF